MSVPEILLSLLAVLAGIWSLYLLILPLLAVLWPTRWTVPARPTTSELPSVSVIVPAHDMELVVDRCVASLLACHYPKTKLKIWVIADHCSDDTISRAKSAGASVLVRDEGPRGKTFTLAWALAALAKCNVDPDLFVIVDATARVAPDFISNLAANAQRGEDIVVGHAIVDRENQQWFARCVGLSLVHRNLQNWSRERLGLSALIEGRGMAYTRRYIKQHGWRLALPEKVESGAHPTEDWRHGVRAVEAGHRVSYAEGARLYTPLRASLGAATQQGIRWERGRTANAMSYGMGLLGKGIRHRDKLKFFAGLDAVQPPVAILGGACLVIGVVSQLVAKTGAGVLFGLVPMTVVGLYGIAVVHRGRHDGIKPVTVLWAPVYIGWRCATFMLALGFEERLRTVFRKNPSIGPKGD